MEPGIPRCDQCVTSAYVHVYPFNQAGAIRRRTGRPAIMPPLPPGRRAQSDLSGGSRASCMKSSNDFHTADSDTPETMKTSRDWRGPFGHE